MNESTIVTLLFAGAQLSLTFGFLVWAHAILERMRHDDRPGKREQ